MAKRVEDRFALFLVRPGAAQLYVTARREAERSRVPHGAEPIDAHWTIKIGK